MYDEIVKFIYDICSVLLTFAKLRIEDISKAKELKCKVKVSVLKTRSSLFSMCRNSVLEDVIPSLDDLIDNFAYLLRACTTALLRTQRHGSLAVLIQSRELSSDLRTILQIIFYLVNLTGGVRIPDSNLCSSERSYYPRLSPVGEHDDRIAVSPSEILSIAEGAVMEIKTHQENFNH